MCLYKHMYSIFVCSFLLLAVVVIVVKKKLNNELDPIYPTPPLGQDMTQGQFLSGV